MKQITPHKLTVNGRTEVSEEASARIGELKATSWSTGGASLWPASSRAKLEVRHVLHYAGPVDLEEPHGGIAKRRQCRSPSDQGQVLDQPTGNNTQSRKHSTTLSHVMYHLARGRPVVGEHRRTRCCSRRRRQRGGTARDRRLLRTGAGAMSKKREPEHKHPQLPPHRKRPKPPSACLEPDANLALVISGESGVETPAM